jgi:hypothetical protein
VLHRVQIGICDFSCPVEGCYDDAAIFLPAGLPPTVVCPRSIRDPGWRLGACFHVDHQVLVTWLEDKLALLRVLLPAPSAQYSLFH